MTDRWESLQVAQEELTMTPCDCCGQSTVQLTGNIFESSGDWLAFYSVRYAKGHPERHPIFRFGTGDWSEGSPKESRWIFEMELNVAQEGVHLLDASVHQPELNASCLDRSDILETPFAQEAFAMFDAVYMKDERLQELRQ